MLFMFFSRIELHVNIFIPNSVVKLCCHFVRSRICQLSLGTVGWELVDYTEASRVMLYT